MGWKAKPVAVLVVGAVVVGGGLVFALSSGGDWRTAAIGASTDAEISVADTFVKEGTFPVQSVATASDQYQALATFVVTRGGNLTIPVSVDWSLKNGPLVDGKLRGAAEVLPSTVAGKVGFDDTDFLRRPKGATSHIVAGSLTFKAEETIKVIRIPIKSDSDWEPDEMFYLDLTTRQAGVKLLRNSARATIKDDDVPLNGSQVNQLSISSPIVSGGEARFTVSRTGPLDTTVTAKWAVDVPRASAPQNTNPDRVAGRVPISATDGTLLLLHSRVTQNPGGQSGTVTFTPKVRDVVLTFKVSTAELDRVMRVKLSDAVGGKIAVGTGQATLMSSWAYAGLQTSAPGLANCKLGPNGNLCPDGRSVAVSDAVVREGNNGSSNATFVVTRYPYPDGSLPPARYRVFTSARGYGTAKCSGSACGQPVPLSPANPVDRPDYDAFTDSNLGAVSFAEGQDSTTFSVPVYGDTTAEEDETFYVTVVGALRDAVGIGTISDDDSCPCVSSATPIKPYMQVIPNPVRVTEGNGGVDDIFDPKMSASNIGFSNLVPIIFTRTGSTAEPLYYVVEPTSGGYPAPTGSARPLWNVASIPPGERTGIAWVQLYGTPGPGPDRRYNFTGGGPLSVIVSDP